MKFTPEELFALSEFFNNENYTMPDFIYTPVGKKLFIAAVKAGLYDED